MITVDAMGLSCPQPVMMAADAIKRNPTEDVRVLVDSATPRDNVARLGKRSKRTVAINEVDGGYEVVLAV